MLAQPARAVADAFAMLGPHIAIEHKIDGARVQIHHAPGGVRIFSRRLNEITQSLPEVAEAAARLGDRHAILDGEVIAVDPAGRPLAFQEVMRRFGRVRDVERLRIEQPIRLFVFDLLALDGELLDRSAIRGTLRRDWPGWPRAPASRSPTESCRRLWKRPNVSMPPRSARAMRA